MPASKRHKKHNSRTLFAALGFTLLVIALPVVIAALNGKTTINGNAQTAGFSFTAAGDYGGGADFQSSLNTQKSSGAQFHLALGDFSYDEITPTAWTNAVKSTLGDTYPFQLISGNHEETQISQYASALPNRMNNITGEYGKEYYFDYPSSSAPLARFIFASPGEFSYSYTKSSTHYQFVSNAIDDARAKGVKWVVVGMHKPCVFIGAAGCAGGADFFNLLVSKKVDLVLYGHHHTYQRSKQLALNASCTAVVPGSYNANCVAASGSTFVKGAGTVMNIIGTGGVQLGSINLPDAESGYFQTWSGGNVQPRKGIVQFTITPSELDAQFLPTTNTSSYTDSYKIVDTTAPTSTVSPSVADTPAPTQAANTPTPTPLVPTPTQIVPTATPAVAATYKFSPAADAFVQSTQASSNFGTLARLHVDSSPQKITYMKFDLRSLAGKTISTAKLRLYVADGTAVPESIQEVADSSWTETGITYNNRPAAETSVIGSIPSALTNKYIDIDLSSEVDEQAGSVLSFAITMPSHDVASYYSKEASATFRPVLTVQAQ